MFEGDDQIPFDDEQAPEESSNRNFMIIAGVLIGIICLTAAGLGFYAVRVLPQQANARSDQEATLIAQNVQANQTLTQMAQSALLSQTPAASATLPATNTPPIQQASATLPAGAAASEDPQTATVAAALTQAAQAQLTVTFLPTSTALPTSGFADEAGLPGLFVMAVALVMVILLARRMRASPAAK